jgi:hypothetical protein
MNPFLAPFLECVGPFSNFTTQYFDVATEINKRNPHSPFTSITSVTQDRKNENPRGCQIETLSFSPYWEALLRLPFTYLVIFHPIIARLRSYFNT